MNASHEYSLINQLPNSIMKHVLLLLASFISLIVSAQNTTVPKNFILKGEVIGQDSGYVHLTYRNSEGKYKHDSCLLKEGSFEFTGDIDEPTSADFYGRRDHQGVADPNFTDFYIEPANMQAVFKAEHFKEGKVTGSKTQEEYSLYVEQSNQLETRWKPVWNALAKAREEKDSITENRILNTQISLYRKEADSLTLNFIKQHPQSFVSADLLVYQTQRLSVDSLKMFYRSLSEPVQRSGTGKYINEFITKAENLLPGKKAPGFIQVDKEGKIVSLKDFAGNYVLLDFWASWCVPCREESPFLKAAYEKYKNKGFTIVSISLDKLEDKDKWLKAIEKDGLSWTQLCDFKGWRGEVVNLYNLLGRGIPSNFLLNPKGEIVARDLRGEHIEEKLAELIK